MPPAGTQDFHSLANFIGRNETLFIGGTENAYCPHYIETDRFCDMPRANLVNKQQVGFQPVGKNQCLALAKVKPRSPPKKRHFLWVDILNLVEYGQPRKDFPANQGDEF